MPILMSSGASDDVAHEVQIRLFVEPNDDDAVRLPGVEVQGWRLTAKVITSPNRGTASAFTSQV
jgi:hypothetical protein